MTLRKPEPASADGAPAEVRDISVRSCQNWLAAIWCVGAAFAVVVGLAEQTTGVPDADMIWGWLSPNIAPTLTLIGGVYAKTHKAKNLTEQADPFRFRLAAVASVFYLVVVLILAAMPLYRTSALGFTTLLSNAGVVIGFMQGAVATFVGSFFATQHNSAFRKNSVSKPAAR